MPDIPQYQYQVAPGRAAGGPSPLQIASLYGETQQQLAIVRGTVDRTLGTASQLVGNIIQRAAQIQQAYDEAKLGRAKAAYFAGMKAFAEELPYSTTPVTDWQEEYERKSRELVEEALEMLRGTTSRHVLGPADQDVTGDAFESWRVEQDAQFSGLVFQNQRLRMTDEVAAQLRTDMSLVKNDAAYLPVLVENVQAQIRANTISADYGATLIEQAKQIALIQAVTHKAQELGPIEGANWLANEQKIDEWVSLPTGLVQMVGIGTMTLDPESKDRVRGEFALWAGQVQADGERARGAILREANREYLDRFYTGRRTMGPDGESEIQHLRIEDLRTDARLQHDPNTPVANENADRIYEHFAAMIRARNEAAARGGKDPNTLTNEALKLAIQQMIFSPMKRELVEELIDQNVGADEEGNPRLTAADQKELHSLVEQYKYKSGYEAAFERLDRNTGATGLFSTAEGERAKQKVATMIQDAELEGKPMTPEQVAEAADNLIAHQYMIEWDRFFSDPSKAPAALRERYENWKEARETGYYHRRGRGILGRGAGMRNLEALVWNVQQGWGAGPADTPEYQQMLGAARPVLDEMLTEWTGLSAGEKNPTQRVRREEEPRVIFDGHILYGVELQSYEDPEVSTLLLLTPYYDRENDRLLWARYDLKTRNVVPLIEPSGAPMPFYRVREQFRAMGSLPPAGGPAVPVAK